MTVDGKPRGKKPNATPRQANAANADGMVISERFTGWRAHRTPQLVLLSSVSCCHPRSGTRCLMMRPAEKNALPEAQPSRVRRAGTVRRALQPMFRRERATSYVGFVSQNAGCARFAAVQLKKRLFSVEP